MKSNHNKQQRAVKQMNKRLAFLTSSRVHVGPCRDPKPTPNSGNSLVNLKRFITKGASAAGEADLKVSDLYNMFGGASFTFKVAHIRVWAQVLSAGAVSFQLSNYTFNDTEDISVIKYADAGDGNHFPAAHFSIPPSIQKDVTPTGASATVVCDVQGLSVNAAVVFEVTGEFRL